MEFNACKGFTVGAEWELQLLDCETLDLAPRIDTLLGIFQDSSYVKPEFFQSCVELNTPVCADAAGIRTHLAGLKADVLSACHENGLALAGGGTHPFCQRLALVTPLPRYEKLASEHGYIGQTQLAFATHVHIGVRSGDEAIRVMRHLTPCLPLLIAIGANSPFWRGYETGYASYRRRLLTASKTYGIPPYLKDWQDFISFYEMAVRSKSIRSIKDIHWDIRPHPDFGTIEIRVTDSQSTVDDVAFIAGLVRCLVAFASEASATLVESSLPPHLTPWIERENHFRSSHWGMESELIGDGTGRLRPIEHYIEKLAGALTDVATDLGETGVVDRLSSIVGNTPGYMQQRQVFDRRNDARDVAQWLNGRFEGSISPG